MIRYNASNLVKDFQDKFGDITCAALLGIDFSDPGAYQGFHESGIWKNKCNKYVEFIIEKLYEFEDGQGTQK
ncbi:MAG: C_GCAxxG_C_C family protein [Deltaproteobacteria bacterium]|nr:C_GCAxxG_C_C family protein [Deltaproteobacteria bacterium]